MSRLQSERRRSWGWYGLAILAVVGALIGAAIPLIRSSDARSTTALMAQHRVQPLLLGPLANSVKLQWSAPSTGRHPTVVANSVVVSSQQHGLIGHDLMTGAEIWKYQRSNAELCDWTIQDNLVVMAFRQHHGCSDLTALRGDTGQRQWYRNIDLGHVTLTSGPQVLVVASESSLLAVDPGTGQDRWTYNKAGCSLTPPRIGRIGVAVAASCPNQQRQLILHELYNDKERWSQPTNNDSQISVADQQVVALSTVDGHSTLESFDEQGGFTGSLTDSRLAMVGDQPLGAQSIAQGNNFLIWTGKSVVAIDLESMRIRWDAASTSPAIVESADTVITAANSSFTLRNIHTGAISREIPITGGQNTDISSLTRIGNSVAITTGSTAAVYG